MEKFPQRVNEEGPHIGETAHTNEALHMGDAPARPYKAAIVTDLVNLDRDLMKLLVRRAKLVGKLRGGKQHAATPSAAKAEKEVRTAWEKNALAFSRDDKFTRQLFTLLQEVRVDSREDAGRNKGFNLAPARRSVAVNIAGPLSVTGTRMLAVLAAALGESISLENVALNTALIDCVKALNGAGAKFRWANGARPGEGSLVHTATPPVMLGTDKALYIGEDLLNVYLLAFLAVARTGKARFTGGSGLKMADLSPLRRFLPELGARMAHSVPKSNGLPAGVESSGVVPECIRLPADLPHEGVMAFFCAVAGWKKKVTIDCGALPLPLFTAAAAECLPILRACLVVDGILGTVITLDARDACLPASGIRILDPVLSAYILALPAFSGGSVTLTGQWETNLPQALQTASLFAWGEIAMDIDETGVSTVMCRVQEGGLVSPLDISDMDESLVPLALALTARACWRKKGDVPLPLLPAGIASDIVGAFYAHLDLSCKGGVVSSMTPEEKTPWTCPSAAWGMAFALCAYDRPGISLANPATVTAAVPAFWPLYNALPDPSVDKKEPEEQKKPRRRIISPNVLGE